MKKKTTVVKRADINTVIEKESQIVRWFDYQCIFTGNLKPMNSVGIERLSREVVNWAFNDGEALKLSQFLHKMGINERTWRRWCAEFPELKEASQTAKSMIGDRREIGALKHEYNFGVVAYTMPFYDSEWKDETVRRASLKEGLGGGDGKVTFQIVTDKIPNSPLVPERKTNE